MRVKLGYTQDIYNIVNKTVIEVHDIIGKVVGEFSHRTPVIAFTSFKSYTGDESTGKIIGNVNYAIIEGDSYFIRDIVDPKDGTLVVHFELDLLRTYSEYIYSREVITSRDTQTSNQNPLIKDDELILSGRKIVTQTIRAKELIETKEWGFYVLATAQDSYDEGNAYVPGLGEKYNPRIGLSGIGLYALDQQNMDIFFKDIWNTTLGEKIGKMFGQQHEGVMSLRWFHGLMGTVPFHQLQPQKITVGNNVMNQWTATPLAWRPKSEFVKRKLSSIPVRNVYNSYLDYSPYTMVDLYIPYYGFYKLDPSIVMGKNIHLVYNTSLMTGMTSIMIYYSDSIASNEDTDFLYDVVQCDVSVDIPINATAVDGMLARAASATTTIAPALIGAAIGAATLNPGAGATAMAAAKASGAAIGGSIGSSVANDTSASVTRSGGLNPEISALAPMEPRLVTSSPEIIFNDSLAMGKPSYGRTHLLQSQDPNNRRYVQVLTVIATPNTSFTGKVNYVDEIINMMKGGIYI